METTNKKRISLSELYDMNTQQGMPPMGTNSQKGLYDMGTKSPMPRMGDDAVTSDPVEECNTPTKKKYKMTEAQAKLFKEIHTIRESMGMVDELNASTYLNAIDKGMNRGDQKGANVVKLAISQLVKQYANTTFSFMEHGNIGQTLNLTIDVPTSSIYGGQLFRNNILTLQMKDEKGQQYILAVSHRGSVTLEKGSMGSSDVMVSRQTANILANFYNKLSDATGNPHTVTRQQFKQF